MQGFNFYTTRVGRIVLETSRAEVGVPLGYNDTLEAAGCLSIQSAVTLKNGY